MDFLNPEILEYAENYSSPEPELLEELNRYTHLNVLMPRMLSGHLQGRFLSMISRMVSPEYVLDIGTYTGYSALCLAEGLKEGGKLYTLDNNDESLSVAGKFISRSDKSTQILIEKGQAIEIISRLNDTVPYWDIVWIDADKASYRAYYNACIEKLRHGGIMMADNVLWSGKVLNKESFSKDNDTKALHEFNEMISSDQRVQHTLLPVRDGIMMIMKR